MSLITSARRSARPNVLAGLAVLLLVPLLPALTGSLQGKAATGPVYEEPPPPTPPDPAPPRPTGKLVPARGALFGIHTIPDSASAKSAADMGITTREAQAGRTLDIDNHYYTWTQNLPTWREQWDISQGRIPLISWMGGDTIEIYNGKFDALIDQRADALKALGAPFFLRWFWEADGTRASKAKLSHSAADYIKAWRYLRVRFDAKGVTNAVWVWCPVSLNFYPKPRGLNPAQPYYPGDDVVDWICADGYNWAPNKPGTRYESFQELFQAFYDFGVSHNKPLMVGETGVQELQPGDKAKWINAMHLSLVQHYPNIVAFLYFDTRNANGLKNEWWLESSPEALSAWKDMAADPYFNNLGTVGEAPYSATSVPAGPPGPGPSPSPDPGSTPSPTTERGSTGPGGQPPAATRSGYWMLGGDGRVYAFGEASSYGDGPAGNTPVDLEPTPSGHGYWVLGSTGHVSALGDAVPFGDAGRVSAGEMVTSLSATPTGRGYWIFTSRGRVLSYGDAGFLGDVSRLALNGPVLGSIATPSGNGYYMVASDGGIFAFGDALFAGSMGNQRLNAPVQSLVPEGDGSGYWLVASDGGVFAFDAPFRGSMGGARLNRPVTGMVPYGNGYLMVGEDGGIFNFSDRPFAGSLGADPPGHPIVSVAAID